MARKKKKTKITYNWFLIILAAVVLSACVLITLGEHFTLPIDVPSWDEVESKYDEVVSRVTNTSSDSGVTIDGELEVYFIDVGQGDSAIIRSGGQTMLVDCGIPSAYDEVSTQLDELKITKLDYVIMTHPHNDHAGCMDDIIKNYDIGTVLMTDLPDELIPTSKFFTNFLTGVAAKGLKLTPAKVGDTYKMGDALITILGPNAEFDELNDTSIVFRLDFGETSFLFTGDIESGAEKSLVSARADLDCDVLKVAHHGSPGSSTDDFIEAVSPDYAVISVGEDNSYSHPAEEVLDKLENIGAEIYRTDKNGTIIASSDGQTISFFVQK